MLLQSSGGYTMTVEFDNSVPDSVFVAKTGALMESIWYGLPEMEVDWGPLTLELGGGDLPPATTAVVNVTNVTNATTIVVTNRTNTTTIVTTPVPPTTTPKVIDIDEEEEKPSRGHVIWVVLGVVVASVVFIVSVALIISRRYLGSNNGAVVSTTIPVGNMHANMNANMNTNAGVVYGMRMMRPSGSTSGAVVFDHAQQRFSVNHGHGYGHPHHAGVGNGTAARYRVLGTADDGFWHG